MRRPGRPKGAKDQKPRTLKVIKIIQEQNMCGSSQSLSLLTSSCSTTQFEIDSFHARWPTASKEDQICWDCNQQAVLVREEDELVDPFHNDWLQW